MNKIFPVLLDRLSDLSDEVDLIVMLFVMIMKWNDHVKGNVVRNFDKFELEEKLLLVCLYNFELRSKMTPSLLLYFELGAKRLWVGGDVAGGETTGGPTHELGAKRPDTVVSISAAREKHQRRSRDWILLYWFMKIPTRKFSLWTHSHAMITALWCKN